jgi:hypothetical protein
MLIEGGNMPVETKLKGDALAWLLEEENPGVRYLALRDIKLLDGNDPELIKARNTAHQQGPINSILEKMEPAGYWMEPGSGYSPKYKSTVWSLILLAQLGARVTEDERIQTACNYLIEHSLTPAGQFTIRGEPSGTIDCLQGNLCWSLLEMGYENPRLTTAFEWMARSITGEGIAPASDRKAPLRYYAYKCGPRFACGPNNKQPCAWGAVKVMMAFGKLEKKLRTPLIGSAIQTGVDFLLGTDPAKAEYLSGINEKPSRNWWKFGFPVFYITDLLQIVEALTALGFGRDPRLKNAIELVLKKQDSSGRWPLEYDYTGKTWRSYGNLNEPNKWVTLRALRMLTLKSC